MKILIAAALLCGAALCRAEIYIALTNFPAQGPIIDAFRYRMANFKNNAFYFDVATEKIDVKVTCGTNEYEGVARYCLWLQDTKKGEKSDLAMIVPGLGDHCRNSQATILGEALFNAGYSACIVSNPFCWEFINSSLSSICPGFTRDDAKDLYRLLCHVREDIEENYPGKVNDNYCIGYSLGALQLAYVQEMDAIEKRLDVKRFVLLSPPVNLLNGLLTLDSFYSIWKKWDEETIRANRNKAMGFYKGYTSSLINQFTYLPISEEEASFVIGMMFRMTLMDTMKSVVRRHPLEIFGDYSSFKQQAMEKQMERYSYQRYADTFLRFAHSNAFTTAEPLKNVNNLCSLPAVGKTLKSNTKVVMLHAMDDFLESDYDRNWLKRTLGNRLVMLDHGSHLGYFCMPQALDIVVNLTKGEPVKGPSPKTAKPTYDYFKAFLAEQAAKGEKPSLPTDTEAASSRAISPGAAIRAADDESVDGARLPIKEHIELENEREEMKEAREMEKKARELESQAEKLEAQAKGTAKPKADETPAAPAAPVDFNAPAASKEEARAGQSYYKDGRLVAWQLMQDLERTNVTVFTMQEVDVDSGLRLKDYEAKVAAEMAVKEDLKKAEAEQAIPGGKSGAANESSSRIVLEVKDKQEGKDE